MSEDGEGRSGAALLVLDRDESSCAGTRRADAAPPRRGSQFRQFSYGERQDRQTQRKRVSSSEASFHAHLIPTLENL